MSVIPEEDLIDLDGPSIRRLLEKQKISLRPNELKRISKLLKRNPTLVELHIFNIMWSEHCSYKSSKRVLKRCLPSRAPHVVLGPGEDAGIIRFADIGHRVYCLVMAHESHNHPSQVLPAEGAATGIGGIVRDVYCMGADVIGVMDPLRFGDPDGPKGRRVRDIARGVVEGIAQYGNALGVPNLGGEIVFDPSFDDNCLVNVVALGVVEEENIIRSRAPEGSKVDPHDIILIGKPTDASGFGGAAFASGRLSEDDIQESQEAVQLPDPFLKRVLAEATKKVLSVVREGGREIGFKDLGAGGISCAVSEMAASGGVGAHCDLDRVNLSGNDLSAEVIACSETQERYVMIVPGDLTDTILRIYNEDFQLPELYKGAGAFLIGKTTGDGRFRLTYHGKTVCEADSMVITEGIEYERTLKKTGARRLKPLSFFPGRKEAGLDLQEVFLQLLSSYNVSDKELVYRSYDTEVQGKAVLRPGEADAAVALLVPGEKVGVVVAVGGNSRLAACDPYLGGVWAVLEAARNVACAGGWPLAITDCLNYGDPEDPGVFWEFSEGVRGIGDACRELRLSEETSRGIPVVSGNVSFYNQSENGEAIAPTPIVACAGRINDVGLSRSMGFKREGSKLVLIGEFHGTVAGSEFEMLARRAGCLENIAARPPEPVFARERAMVKALLESYERSLVLAAHDVSHGGILVALAEMMTASTYPGAGCRIDFGEVISGGSRDEMAVYSLLFSEYGGMLVEVGSEDLELFGGVMEKEGAPWRLIGETTGKSEMEVRLESRAFTIGLSELLGARAGRLQEIFGKER